MASGPVKPKDLKTLSIGMATRYLNINKSARVFEVDISRLNITVIGIISTCKGQPHLLKLYHTTITFNKKKITIDPLNR